VGDRLPPGYRPIHDPFKPTYETAEGDFLSPSKRYGRTWDHAQEDNWVPVGDKIVVRPFEQIDTTPTGIVLPEVARVPNPYARVMMLGEGIWHPKRGEWLPFGVEAGDVVIINHNAGRQMKWMGENVLLIFHFDILAILVGFDEWMNEQP
jgi:chaperonin GroES